MLLDYSVLSETQTSADPFCDVLPDPKVCKSFFRPRGVFLWHRGSLTVFLGANLILRV
jgi:hypothetical protein